MKTAQQVAKKWVDNTSNATQAMIDGVNGVTESPTAKAAAAVDRQVQGVIAAAQSGRTAAKLNAVSLDSWKNSFKTKGVPRISQGVQAAQPKMQAFLNDWMPLMNSVSAEVKNMPKGSIQAGLARVQKVMEAGKRYAGKS